ncbi:hypothetical protein ACLOJK_012852 [Asimina triloba]
MIDAEGNHTNPARDIITAGSDTTAITLEWAMAELMKDPVAVEKAQAEVRSVGRSSKVEEDADIPQMEYVIFI